MTHVVIDNCKDCRFTDCVTVCPVDCFHIGDDMLYIDPAECIDCAACVPECPVDAILMDEDVTDDKQEWIGINAEKAPGLPVITDKLDPLPTAEDRKTALGF